MSVRQFEIDDEDDLIEGYIGEQQIDGVSARDYAANTGNEAEIIDGDSAEYFPCLQLNNYQGTDFPTLEIGGVPVTSVFNNPRPQRPK